MKHLEGNFQNAQGANLYYQAWMPEGEVKAILLIAHGLAEHSGRYLNLVNHLAPLGYALYGVDHLGHGKSEGQRVYLNRFDDYVVPLKTLLSLAQKAHPAKPVFLLGHSMGGLIAGTYLLEHQSDLAGAILSAPAAKISDSISPATIFIAKLLSNLAPRLGVAALDANAISKDPQVVQAYLNDPLVYSGKVTARLGAEMFAAIDRLQAQATTIRLPLLLVQGSADTLVDPAGTKLLYQKASSTDKTLKMYEGLYHEVMNEPERAQVLQDIQTWLAARLP
jgi:alpha-beta hydrolase superfamily lysophospholipase